jgi:hypothetical protein
MTTMTDRISGTLGGLAFKAPVVAVTTENITLSGLQSISGVSLVADDRVLVRSQADATENGIYLASTSEWQRAKDFDGNRDAVEGTLVRDNNYGVVYSAHAAGDIDIGTTEITFPIASITSDFVVSVTSSGAIGDGVTNDSSAILSAITALRRNAISILDTIGGNTITAYTSGELYFPPGVYLVPPDVLNFTQDLGLTLRGAGSRGKSNFNRGATTLLISGTSSGYGIRAYRNGARNLKIMDMDICYATSGFTGSLIDVLDAPGLHLIRCYVGTYGITAGTRLQTAASLIRSTYDEFMTFDSCVFDGAVRGWWSDDTRTELANTFGGSVTNFNNCTFYDFSENHIYHGGTRTRQTLNLNGTIFNPISVSPSSSCINIDNVEGLNLKGVQFTPSTTYAPASQWLRATNCTGTIDGNTFDDLAPAGLLSGKLAVNGNRIYCTSGFTLQQGVITGRANEFSKGTSGWILSPTAPLCVDLGPDEFKADVTNSYYIAADSANLSGRIRYCYDLDASTAKFTNASSRVLIENDDNKDISVSASTYTISIRDTGRTIVATGAGAQTFTLPTPIAGTRLYIFKSVAQDLTINCAAATNFFAGNGAAKSSVDSAAADVGGFIELEAYGSVGWKVASVAGTWVFS